MASIEFRAKFTLRAGKKIKYCKFAVPMPDANYNLHLELPSGVDLGTVTFTEKTTSQFTFTCTLAPVGDTDFSVLVYYYEDSLS